ncbi:hypothetical protein Bca52824_006635 [Brassica carinata]|uniref:RRM domain-containing protein n=1 Tax=Brassica carinata TaxID=52824 RepID=A0A8X8B7D4_BRACI|nr:hypothetical protein Bca52824_006635 [Brassica carinata]
MSVRGGSRKEDRARNPPSRHLWVGNLPLGISERELADRFLRFGELESVAFQPARSYAFLNFKHDEDAFAAFDSLQGFPLNGNELKIEFAKPEKSSTGSRTENIFRHDEQRSGSRGSPFFQKDSRMRYESPDTYSRPNKMSDRDAEPSEVLYIGFPASLKVDEALLMKFFSPFGDIAKVTIFPGRSYAFVQFRDLMAACKAKETLQGKLFDNPRVHISFAKSEPSSSSTGRGPSGRSFSPPYRSVDRLGSSECYFHQDRNYGSISRISSERDPHYIADRGFEESEDYMFNRKRASRNEYDRGPPYRRSRSPHKLPQDMHEYHREMVSTFRDDPHRFPSRSSVYEEPRGLSEEDYYYQDTKRVKTRSTQPDRQLPGHLVSGVGQERRSFSRASADFSPNKAFDRNYEAGQLRYKQTVEKPLNLAIRNGERSSFREQHDELVGDFSLPEGRRHTLEKNRPSLKDWNWEGTIAKGGNPICRAKCFPVGKVMDMMLPEFLDCTARTGLDMLANHYYQSSQAWVVFFVPGSDADIVFYNEFMHYLEEKQRAAVSKLDDTTTLFLVPPSDFSEKVLKVPGKLSISGVILRSEYEGSGYGPVQQQGERRYGETSYPEDSGAFPDVGNPRNPGPAAFLSSAARDVQQSPVDPYIESRHDQYSGRVWPPRDVSVNNTRSSQMQPPLIDLQEHSGFVAQQNADPSRFRETEIPSGFQPEQFSQLASSMSRQPYQVDNTSNQPDRYAADARSSFHPLQHEQTPSAPPGYQNVQLQGSSNTQEGEEDNEANPQKRLQATLQLAAALLQQIQQSKN